MEFAAAELLLGGVGGLDRVTENKPKIKVITDGMNHIRFRYGIWVDFVIMNGVTALPKVTPRTKDRVITPLAISPSFGGNQS